MVLTQSAPRDTRPGEVLAVWLVLSLGCLAFWYGVIKAILWAFA